MGEQNTKWTFYVYQQFFHSGWSLRRYLTIKVGSIQYFNLHVHCKKFNYNATTPNCTICMIQFQKIMFQLLCTCGKTPKFPNFEKKGAQPFRVKCKLDSASYSTGYHYMAAKSSKCILCGGRTSCDLLLLSDFFRLQFAIVIGLISFSKYITQFEIRHVIDKC